MGTDNNTDDDDYDISTWVGTDTDDNRYESVRSMWLSQGVTSSSNGDWYQRGAQHYEDHCPPTLDGVLGGFAEMTQDDLQGSLDFVRYLQQSLGKLGGSPASEDGQTILKDAIACECGAGIGRVSKGLLLQPLGFGRCDLVESSPHLLASAPEYLGDAAASKCRYYCNGLQEWGPPQPNMYHLIWIQWVFCYLTDNDAIAFLKRCRKGLVQEGGLIILKENACPLDSTDDFVLDLEDASVTRSIRYLKYLAQEAGLRIVHLLETQSNFPEDNFPVPMIALEPATDSK